ncbi:hypothetical protein HK098_005926 [Nowakowskiella sp. JEL0407]|nr:hypothetical protein HK098_005926 [Nowakowskiella sp. JEL0407]
MLLYFPKYLRFILFFLWTFCLILYLYPRLSFDLLQQPSQFSEFISSETSSSEIFSELCKVCPVFIPGRHHLEQPQAPVGYKRLFCSKCVRRKLNEAPQPLGILDSDSWVNITDLHMSQKVFDMPTRERVEEILRIPLGEGSEKRMTQEKKYKEETTLDQMLEKWDVYSNNKVGVKYKYFHESKEWWQDARFQVKLPKSERNLKRQYESEIVRAWMDFANKYGIITWTSHGNMLSWYWGRSQFPWDKDTDFQMAASQLPELWRLNGTFSENGRFFIDVNPHSAFRYPQRAESNKIDARVIDTHSGMYMDLTVLAKLKGQVLCKSPHFYVHDDIFPLKSTIFEGIVIWRPNHALMLLRREYRKGALKTPHYAYKKHYWWDDAILDWTTVNPGGKGGSLGQNEGQPPQRRMQINPQSSKHISRRLFNLVELLHMVN